jgi:tRNA (mo5U34)-methyltransferase
VSELLKLTISDRELAEINAMLDWHAGTLLPDGRLLGKLAVRAKKRVDPQRIPDKRIVKLDQLVGLSGKRVLEVGCFEGIHTLGLRQYCDDVTAIDVRPANVMKTLARLAYHGSHAKVFQMNVEELNVDLGVFDVIFHCGVLYHLLNPVEQLISVGNLTSKYLFLDTHIARDEKKIETRLCDRLEYRGAYHDEGGWRDPFSGKDARAFWLTYESLIASLRLAGFQDTQLLEERSERNGPRVSLLASKT